MSIRPIHAELITLRAPFRWFAQHEMEPTKVEAVRALVRAGAPLPPPVLVGVGREVAYMPIDGHHRTRAHDLEGCDLAAWVVGGRAYENLCIRCRDEGAGNPDDYVLCAGVKAHDVALDFDRQTACNLQPTHPGRENHHV